MLGFWLYLMSDCLIFAMLFAVFGVLGGNYAAGPGPKELFDLEPGGGQHRHAAVLVDHPTASPCWRWTGTTRARPWSGWPSRACLAWPSWAIELYEFAHLIHEGATPQRSGFLSAFFTLVGTHGLHVTFGIIWLVTLMVQVGMKGLIPANKLPADVPVDVLAHPGRHLDRRLHLRLSAGDGAMSADKNDHSPDSHETDHLGPRGSQSRLVQELYDRFRAVGDPDGHSVRPGHDRRPAGPRRRR